MALQQLAERHKHELASSAAAMEALRDEHQRQTADAATMSQQQLAAAQNAAAAELEQVVAKLWTGHGAAMSALQADMRATEATAAMQVCCSCAAGLCGLSCLHPWPAADRVP